ncbi:30S ribosomal protein S7 [Candidatus Daviesbacteria bacterium]|nr:30S ribosomal protein S7 [Candidatus Daviesbacteria bacterium]
MRSKKAPKRILAPDPIYNSRLLHRFINKVMKDGKKDLAQRLVYLALDQIKKAKGEDVLKVFEQAVSNVSPKMEVRPRRVGGASYQVPAEVRGDRREALAIRWIIEGAKSRPNKEFHHFYEKLAAELQDASQNTGWAIKKKDDMQKVAAANRAFAHFRW